MLRTYARCVTQIRSNNHQIQQQRTNLEPRPLPRERVRSLTLIGPSAPDREPCG